MKTTEGLGEQNRWHNSFYILINFRKNRFLTLNYLRVAGYKINERKFIFEKQKNTTGVRILKHLKQGFW